MTISFHPERENKTQKADQQRLTKIITKFNSNNNYTNYIEKCLNSVLYYLRSSTKYTSKKFHKNAEFYFMFWLLNSEAGRASYIDHFSPQQCCEDMELYVFMLVH